MGPPHASHSPLSKHKSGPEKFLRATSVLCSLHGFSAQIVTICGTYRAENTQNQLSSDIPCQWQSPHNSISLNVGMSRPCRILCGERDPIPVVITTTPLAPRAQGDSNTQVSELWHQYVGAVTT
jgi:hypothetical protein